MIVPIAAKAHHRAHIAPVARLLGNLVGPYTGMARARASSPDDVALIASYGDLPAARRGGFRRIILMQHGAGQSYGGDVRTARHPCYPGGDDNSDVGLFLVPNEHAANRWRERYPSTSVEVVGCPRLDVLPSRAVSMDTATTVEASPVVAVSWHWNYHGIPEMRSAFDHYKRAVVELAREVTVIGHGHPKRKDLPAFYRDNGIEYVPDFDDVLRRADVYACDNSSTLYEFASTGRPVVVLNAPWYRRDVWHGLRFWEAAGIGANVDDPAYLSSAVGTAIEDGLVMQLSRQAALGQVYKYRQGAAQRAADAIAAWAGMEVGVRLLDLFCGGGGAAMGYHRAGFEVVGVDINPQPNYPFEFIQTDVLGSFPEGPPDLGRFDVIHASPPCQSYTRKGTDWGRQRNHWIDHPDLLAETRELLKATGLPYVIENVPGAPIDAQVEYCGTHFGLRIIKHRLFEANWALPFPPASCDHSDVYNPWAGADRSAEKLREAMGIDWLPISGGASRKAGYTGDLFNAIPPAYTEHIGKSWLA